MQANLRWAGAVLLLGVAGCAVQSIEPEAEASDRSKIGAMMYFSEKEPGTEPNTIGIFVNPDFIRIDDRRAPDDFILFDRKSRYIYNVISSDKSIAIITPKPVLVKPPIAIEYTEEKQESAAVPRGADSPKGFHYKFLANGKECYNVVVVEGYLPDVVAALTEFRTVLAGEHATVVGTMPPEQQDACDLALNIFDPVRHLSYGFPVREWNSKGYSKFLTEARGGMTVEKQFLELPAAYTRHAFGAKH